MHRLSKRVAVPLLLAVGFATPAPGQAQSADTLRIGVLVDEIGPDSAAVFNLMFDEIRAVVGADAAVIFEPELLRETLYDPNAAATLYSSLVESRADVILAFGPVTAAAVSRLTTYPKPTVLFGAVNNDIIEITDTDNRTGIDNFTFVVTSQSYRRDLETFRTLYPFQRVGVVVPEAQAGVVPIRETLDRYFAGLDASYRLVPYRDVNSLRPFLDEIDAVYLADSWGLSDTEIEELATTLVENRLPSFSGVRRQDVELGFMASNHPEDNLEQFFRRIALHVEAVANGENLADRPIFVNFDERLTMNFNTAELVGVPLRYSLIGSTEFVGDFVNSLSEQTYTLAEVVEEALDQNLALRLARQDVQLAQQDVRSAWTNYLPTLSARGTGTALDPDLARLSGGSNPQYSSMGSLVLNQVLFSPGATAAVNIQGNLLRAQEENLRASEQDLVLDAANAYFNALILKANLQIQNENLDVTRRNLATAEANLAAGQAGRGDVLRLTSEFSRDMQGLIEALNQLEQAYYAINQLLNKPINREIDVLDPSLEAGVNDGQGYERLQEVLDDPASRVAFEDYLVGQAVANAHELSSLDFNIAVAERTMKLNGGQRFLPTISAVGQYDRTFDQGGAGLPDPSAPGIDGYYSAALSLSIPLFEANTRNVDRQIAKIQRDQLTLSRESLAEALERNVRSSVLELVNQVANIELSNVTRDAAAESLELTEAAYSNGAVSVVDLLDAQTNLFQAQISKANADYGFLSAAMSMGRLVGHFFLLSTEAENNAFFAGFEATLNSQTEGLNP